MVKSLLAFHVNFQKKAKEHATQAVIMRDTVGACNRRDRDNIDFFAMKNWLDTHS